MVSSYSYSGTFQLKQYMDRLVDSTTDYAADSSSKLEVTPCDAPRCPFYRACLCIVLGYTFMCHDIVMTKSLC